ncbi:DUF7674 family protein [Sphaerisporangium fuscum]|uniref:DUF7674 family protein n=1 Tax=Sphaerisporangium fuscum TaxID=2835868 RepID=UPI001BDC1B85|nr:hypothetical protein [Sphaerisporangium fuscum]
MDAGLSYERIADLLIAEVPEFAPVVQEHVACDDEVLQHVLFGDLTRFVLKAHQCGDDAVVGRCLAFLEQAMMASDLRLRELVAVSFVENVGPWDAEVADFIASWPPALRQEAAVQGWPPVG